MNKKAILIGVLAIAIVVLGVEVVSSLSFNQSGESGQDVLIYEEVNSQSDDIDQISVASDEIVGGEAEENTSNNIQNVETQEDDVGNAKATQDSEVVAQAPDFKTMVVAGGCFWCVEADMEKAPGVEAVVSGYSGGELESPTYKTYGDGGHREVVQVIYDANVVTYQQLLYYFVKHIDPTDPNGSFVDRGIEYSPAIYYKNPGQKIAAEEVLQDIESQEVYSKSITVPVLPEQEFWLAEDYHQDFYKKSIVRYQSYRKYSGRDQFVKKHWGDEADKIPEYDS